MKLPHTLFKAVESAMKHHGHWHLARVPKEQVKMADRANWDDARKHFGTHSPTPRNAVGAGAEFLRFHHQMIGDFKKLVANTTGHSYVYEPWLEIPMWVRERLPAKYLETAEARIQELIQSGSEEELGAFIESSYDRSQGSDLHNRVHGIIGWFEYEQEPKNPDTAAAAMDNFAVAHLNEHFWGLHGWIDAKYAAWKLAHGLDPALQLSSIIEVKPPQPGKDSLTLPASSHLHAT